MFEKERRNCCKRRNSLKTRGEIVRKKKREIAWKKEGDIVRKKKKVEITGTKKSEIICVALLKKWSFALRISSINVTKIY